MNTGVPEVYVIPACSWRRAQQRPSDRFKIGTVDVEESTIESRIAALLIFLKTTVSMVGDLPEY